MAKDIHSELHITKGDLGAEVNERYVTYTGRCGCGEFIGGNIPMEWLKGHHADHQAEQRGK